MNNQEMQFADPEWQPPQQGSMNTDPREQEPYVPQPINADPRQQPRWQTTPPPEQERVYTGPDSYADIQAEKIGVGQLGQRPRRRRSPWLWLIVVLIAFALIGRISTPFYGPLPHSEQHLKPVSFSVGIHPTIVINDPFGTIDVHAGSANTVTINPTQENGFGNPPQINYDQSQDSNTITVTVEDANSVNFDVTVPSNADLQLDTNTGDIDVTGASGQMSLSSTTGTINATQDSLSGQSTLSSTTGTINATQDSLSGQSKLETNSGSITFNGSINPNGTYQFESNSGSIDVTLPGNSSFHVDAMTTTGSISSAFPEVNIHSDGSGAHGDVGSPPRATVTLNTNSGSISLNKQ